MTFDHQAQVHASDPNPAQRLGCDPRVSLSIEGLGLHPIGLREYLVVYGTARIEEGGAAELLRRLARVYMGPDSSFPPDENPPPGWITRITPGRLGGAGPWLSGQ